MIQSAMKTLTTLYLLVLSADNFCKQIGSRSGPTKGRAWSGSKLFDTQMVFITDSFREVDFEKKAADDKKACKNFSVGKDLNRKDTDHQPVHHLYSMSQLLGQAVQTSLLWNIRHFINISI